MSLTELSRTRGNEVQSENQNYPGELRILSITNNPHDSVHVSVRFSPVENLGTIVYSILQDQPFVIEVHPTDQFVVRNAQGEIIHTRLVTDPFEWMTVGDIYQSPTIVSELSQQLEPAHKSGVFYYQRHRRIENFELER